MTPEAVLLVVARAGVVLEATPEGLRYTAAHGLTPKLRMLVVEHRTELLAYLAPTTTPKSQAPAAERVPKPDEQAIGAPGGPATPDEQASKPADPGAGDLELQTGEPTVVPLPRPPERPAGKRGRQFVDRGRPFAHSFETVTDGETCSGCGRSSWRLTPTGAWLCAGCSTYWTGHQARPAGWPDRWPEPAYPCVGGCGADLAEGVLYCSTCWGARRGAYGPAPDEKTNKRASKQACGTARKHGVS